MNPRAKFKNIRENGFHSRKEARRAAELELLEKLGEISNLRKQVRVNLIPKQGKHERACDIILDFVYDQNGEEVWEDTKSKITKTPAYVIKRKLALWVHKKRIKET